MKQKLLYFIVSMLFLNQSMSASDSSFFSLAQKNARSKSSFETFKIGKIQTPEQYLEESYQYSRYFGIITRNVKITRLIMNAQGDGNCGYRAFLGSIFFNAIMSGNKSIILEMQQLIDVRFNGLFMRYNNDFNKEGEGKINIVLSIQSYLHRMIDKINRMSTIEEVRDLLNTEFTFDYYMIMFFRYLIVDYIENSLLKNENVTKMIRFIVAPEKTNPKKRELELKEEDRVSKLLTPAQAIFIGALQADRLDPATYINQILTWQDQLTLDQSKLLGLLLSVSVYTLSEENEYQPLAISLSPREIAIATLLYMPGHYRIFIPVSYDRNVLSTFFEVKKIVKKYDSVLSHARDFWSNQEMMNIIKNIIKNKSSRIAAETADFIVDAAQLGNALQQAGQLQQFADQYMLLNKALITVRQELDSENVEKIINLKRSIASLVSLLQGASTSLSNTSEASSAAAVTVPLAIDKKMSVKALLEAIDQDQKDDENLLAVTHAFWQEYYDSVNHLLDMNAHVLGSEMLVIINNALSLGEKLVAIKRLQDFQLQYQTLGAVLRKITSIVDQKNDKKIKSLKKRSKALIVYLNLHETKKPSGRTANSFADDPYDVDGTIFEIA